MTPQQYKLPFKLSTLALAAENPNHPQLVPLAGVYHRLLQQWSET